MYYKAQYHDGTLLEGTDRGKKELGTGLIDRNKLKVFAMYRSKNGKPFFIAHFPEGGKRKLIFRRRIVMKMGATKPVVVYLVGWHENVNGTSVKSICYIQQNGLVEFDDSRNDIELIPAEEF